MSTDHRWRTQQDGTFVVDSSGEDEHDSKHCLSPTTEFEETLQLMTDLYGQTPPRTRLNRRQRQRRQKEVGGLPVQKETRRSSVLSRSNTLDTLLFSEMCDKADKDRDNETREEAAKEGNRKSKRTLKLLRETERDLKLDVAAAVAYGERAEPLPVTTPNNIKVETRNRFRCLRSKPVDVLEPGPESASVGSNIPFNKEDSVAQSPRSQSLKEREIFHDTFSFLIKLVQDVKDKVYVKIKKEQTKDIGSTKVYKYAKTSNAIFPVISGSTDKDRCRRQMSHEETRWQNELKDLIWLELQAHHAERTPLAQDEYLCKQREAVGALLTEIIEYRFDPVANVSDNSSLGSTLSNDSGIESVTSTASSPNIELGVCPGCLSMFCRACIRSQSEALKQVEGLLGRLETAEGLYPSSQAFAANYPLYKSPEFTDRVKAMCLWYNMTKHHRLKLLILGKLLMLAHAKMRQDDSVDSGISSRSSDTTDSIEQRQSVVRFDISHPEDNASPSDSNNSNASSFGGVSFAQSWSPTADSLFTCNEDDRLDRVDSYIMEFDRHAYRKYIEDVLKTRGLRKSLNFLEILHTAVLRKARLTLEKYDGKDGDGSASEEYEGDRELRRYGVWSKEAKELNLPSYRAAFVFLTRVPLDLVHEFLRMRLEQKPEQPSALSVRQLMRELREGLRIACIHRDRFEAHSKAAVASDKVACESLFDQHISEFDENLKAVFELYLNYLKQWVDMVQHDSFHKNLIEDEWSFVKSIAGDIKDGYGVATIKFCEIACTMLYQVKEFLINRPKEIESSFKEGEHEDEISTKLTMMSVGRELQGMFVEARERIVKSVAFARCLRRDIEKMPKSFGDFTTSILELKGAVLDLRSEITKVIEDFQISADRIKEPLMETERISVNTRTREILHQAYKMGFDYHKELCKLFLPEERVVLARSLVSFALLWMDFVRTRCERGRGLRPRWANQGLEYLMTVCEPLNTKHLTDQEFEELKTCMDRCISHVVGTATPAAISDVEGLRKLPKSRAASPVRVRSRTPSLNLHQKFRDSLESPEVFGGTKRSPTSSSTNIVCTSDGNLAVSLTVPERGLTRPQRVALAVKKLEREIEERLRSRELIGQLTDRKAVDRVRIKSRRVTFTWQRGIKIGQGRFGKVYTVVNNRTGELLAMKEVQLQPGDHRAIKRVAEELEIFEGIQHKHLVRYYGVEIHREEMLIFMEFCAEGTLESLVAGSGNGLPESLVRKYTRQLLLAVSTLHAHGIVHRDIKPANIFLTDEGNCLKLGDFGSAVQIKAHTTMPGELQGFVGTQAYMAPEVFMKTGSEGHGRAADIWSVGCCVIEMASGRRPWAEYDSNYQIMFKVGMGESPATPKNLSAEGIDFIDKCLQHQSRKRATANALLIHTFAKAYEDVNADLSSRSYNSGNKLSLND